MPDLIAKSDIVTICSINTNVEERKLKPGIEDAHHALEKVLGTTGYALVYATPGDYADLVPLCKKYMAWFALDRAYPDLRAEADKGGVFTKSGEDYTAVSDKGLALLQAQAKDRSDMWFTKLIDHLIANPITYPWFGTNVDGEQRIDKTNKLAGGLSLRQSARQTPYRG